jgi:hypothetical protein
MSAKTIRLALSISVLLILIVGVVALVYLSQRTQIFENQAANDEVSLAIDLAEQKPTVRIWQNLAQGGEVPKPQLPAAIHAMQELGPNYVRIDHIYDAYEVIQRNETGKIIYDFHLLDQEVDAITKAGAVPFFSLSYVTSDIADLNNADRPMYALWEDVVRQTVQHYSGVKNIPNVYYEVYNEPDLFGKWTVEEYSELYDASVKGAQSTQNVQPYYIGGPATSYFDRNFMQAFLEGVAQKNTRIDFVSWHVYSTDPTKIQKYALVLDEIL